MFFLELSCFFDDPADVGNLPPARAPRYDAFAPVRALAFMAEQRAVLSHEHAGHGEVEADNRVRQGNAVLFERHDEGELGHRRHGPGRYVELDSHAVSRIMDAGPALDIAVNPFAGAGMQAEEQNKNGSRHESGQDRYPMKVHGNPQAHTSPIIASIKLVVA